MKLNCVLVTYKNPSKLRTASSRAAEKRLKSLSSRLYLQTKQQQKSHIEAIKYVCRILKEHCIDYKVVLRDKLKDHFKKVKKYPDIIITIGGDGSVLAASHIAGKTPLLGVNSLPKTSVGFFCSANIKNFEKKLLDIAANKIKPIKLPMLDVWIGGKKIDYPALNDILFAGESPAETVQYIIEVDGKKEKQRSSGIWISAGPGSTAGIKSAGGTALAITSKRLQFCARELCAIPHTKYKLKRGFAPYKGSIKIISETEKGRAYLDGVNYTHPVPRGSSLKVKVSNKILKIFL